MYTTPHVAPAVGAVAGGSAAASTQTGAAAILAFTGAALASYVATGVLLIAAGALLRWMSGKQPQHN